MPPVVPPPLAPPLAPPLVPAPVPAAVAAAVAVAVATTAAAPSTPLLRAAVCVLDERDKENSPKPASTRSGGKERARRGARPRHVHGALH